MIFVQQSTDSGANWTLICSIGSAEGPKGFVVFYDATGTVAPVLGTREALYSIDISGKSYDTFIDMRAQASTHNCRRMVVAANGALYCPLGEGGILKVSPNTSTGAFDVVQVGPDRGDGVPSDRQGHAMYLVPTNRWVFVAYGGHSANHYASVFAVDTETDALHGVFKHDTANLEARCIAVSAETDDVAKLHVAVFNSLSDAVYHIDEILTNPKASTTIKYNAAGIIQLPEFNGGMAEVPTCFLEAVVDADGLSADTSGEWIDCDYGLNGASYTTTDLGDFLSGDTDLSFGSGAGVNGRTIKVQLTLNRGGTNTNKPSLKTFVLNYLKVPATRYEYYVEVDVEATARLRGGFQTPDTIRTELETLQDSVVMKALQYGAGATAYVKVMPPVRYSERLSTMYNQYQDAWRRGNVVLHLVELL